MYNLSDVENVIRSFMISQKLFNDNTYISVCTRTHTYTYIFTCQGEREIKTVNKMTELND